MKFATKPTRYNPLHVRHVATLPWKIKKSNFSRYLAHMDENAKLHFKFTAFNCSKVETFFRHSVLLVYDTVDDVTGTDCRNMASFCQRSVLNGHQMERKK